VSEHRTGEGVAEALSRSVRVEKEVTSGLTLRMMSGGMQLVRSSYSLLRTISSLRCGDEGRRRWEGEQ
jgi:hypothetical protein